MIYAFTGHRPDKLGGYEQPARNKLQVFVNKKLIDLKPDKCITGMALGLDIAIAKGCEMLGIPYIAAIPFPDQKRPWTDEDIFIYDYLVAHAAEVVTVCPKYIKGAYQIRDEWMVDHGDHLISLWNGTPGGTCNTVKYAKKVNKPMTNWWPEWDQFNNPSQLVKQFS